MTILETVSLKARPISEAMNRLSAELMADTTAAAIPAIWPVPQGDSIEVPKCETEAEGTDAVVHHPKAQSWLETSQLKVHDIYQAPNYKNTNCGNAYTLHTQRCHQLGIDESRGGDEGCGSGEPECVLISKAVCILKKLLSSCMYNSSAKPTASVFLARSDF